MRKVLLLLVWLSGLAAGAYYHHVITETREWEWQYTEEDNPGDCIL